MGQTSWAKKLRTIGLMALPLLMVSGCGQGIMVFNPAGPVAKSELQLIWLQIFLILIVVIPVFILLAFIVIRYRDKPDNKAPYKPEWSENRWLEVVWWGIPIVIVAILSVSTVQKTFALTKPPVQTAKSSSQTVKPLVIEVTSMDWKWLFQYPDQKIATVNYCVIPTNRPVEFMLTADGPMNAFWVPRLGGMEYTMPGMIMKLWLQADKVDTYYGHGGNFTGQGFAHMSFSVKAVSEGQFESWASGVQDSGADLTVAGYQKLAKPSIVSEMTFATYPPGIFQKTVMALGGQYMKHDMQMLNSIHSDTTNSMSNSSSMSNSMSMSNSSSK